MLTFGLIKGFHAANYSFVLTISYDSLAIGIVQFPACSLGDLKLQFSISVFTLGKRKVSGPVKKLTALDSVRQT